MDYGLAAALLLLPGVFWSPTASAEVRAGVARETFVLPARVPLAGYSRRDGKPSQGLHDPVGVRALVLQDADTTAALVSCDLLIIDEPLVDAVRQRLLARGWPPDGVLILAATHTHSGPGAYGRRFVEKVSMGHFDPAVFDALAEAITTAVVRARDRLVPVRLAYRTARTEGLVVNRMEEGGMVDADVAVCALYETGNSTPLAVLVSFAAHPTTLGAWNRQLSADYPGVVVREIERRLPSTTCLFFAGAVGDQAPRTSGEGFERSERVGLPLAEQVLALLSPRDAEAPAAVVAAQERLPLPPPRVRLTSWLTLPRVLGGVLVDDDATLSLLAVGDVVVFGVPCDLTAELGEALKEAARARQRLPLIAGFANDYIGYCVPARLYHARRYETAMAFNGPKAGELIVQRLDTMLDKVVTSGE